jgi:predicted negative regulator of RcsB-dependent stress response
MNKVAPETQIFAISDAPESAAVVKRKERDESVAALREFFKELFRYLFTLFCFTLVIFLDSNWSQKHSNYPTQNANALHNVAAAPPP